MADNIPKSIMQGELKIGNFILKTHVLDDGRRIIEEESLIEFFAYLANGGRVTTEDGEGLAKFIRGIDVNE